MNAYRKDQERKRRSKAVKEKFPEMEKSFTDNTPKKAIRINNKTIVFAPAGAEALNIRSRYE